MTDQGQTPNVQNTTFTYEDGKILECEVRNVYTPEPFGWWVYGTKGFMRFEEDVLKRRFEYKVYLGKKETPEAVRPPDPDIDHFGIFARAARENRPEILTCDIEESRISANLCLMADIAYRLRRDLAFDPKKEQFADSAANAMRTREYRKPYSVPEKV
jgi:hypothetical protein